MCLSRSIRELSRQIHKPERLRRSTRLVCPFRVLRTRNPRKECRRTHRKPMTYSLELLLRCKVACLPANTPYTRDRIRDRLAQRNVLRLGRVVVPACTEVVPLDNVEFVDDRFAYAFHVGRVQRGRMSPDDGHFGNSVLAQGVEQDVFACETGCAGYDDVNHLVSAEKKG